MINEYYRVSIVTEASIAKMLRNGISIGPIDQFKALCIVLKVCEYFQVEFPALNVCNSLAMRLKGIVGLYDPWNRIVYIREDYLTVEVVLHELAHHFCNFFAYDQRGSYGEECHGEDFLTMLSLMWEAFIDIYCQKEKAKENS